MVRSLVRVEGMAVPVVPNSFHTRSVPTLRFNEYDFYLEHNEDHPAHQKLLEAYWNCTQVEVEGHKCVVTSLSIDQPWGGHVQNRYVVREYY